MAFKAEQTEQAPPQAADKPAINASEYWKRPAADTDFSIKTGVNTTPDSLLMTSPYGKNDDVLKVSFTTPTDGPTIKPYIADKIELYKPIVENIPKDKSLEDLLHPKDSTDVKEPLTPREEADKRDATAMMDVIRTGKLDDLKNLVSDMSPEKLKRVTEQMKAEGYDITTTKDGKFVIFNKELGLGVSVQPGKDGQPAKAEVVKKDKDGNYVASTDGLDPEKLLKNISSQMPLSSADVQRLVKDYEREHPRDPLHPHRKPWDLDRDPWTNRDPWTEVKPVIHNEPDMLTKHVAS